MPLFRRENEDRQASTPHYRQPAGAPPAPGTRERPATRIAEGTCVRGEITGTTELVVDGEVEGEIRLDGRAVVGTTGVVRGRVTARSVLVAGRVEGDVRGSERVEMGGSGNLQGDISAPRVTIAEGAFFKGKVEMGGGDALTPKAPGSEARGESAGEPGGEPPGGVPEGGAG
ncbi:MAG TPA: polymer-forming cytoskeletal protein [Thermoanaerobaculia bacterium]|nr:polymer-forming cytoskeletal protein [Thermoanaerobaculia bacterium]